MRRGAAVTMLVLVAAALGGAPAPAKTPSSCAHLGKSAHVRFKQGGVRLLWIRGGEGEYRWFLCSPKFKRPKLWFDAPGVGLETLDEHFRRAGNRILFRWDLDDGESGYSEVGFLDLGTGRRKAVEVDSVAGFAVSPGGVLAWIDGAPTATQTIWYARVSNKPRFLVDVPDGGIDAKTLRVTDDGVAWNSTGGESRTVPFSYKPPEWGFMREFPIPSKRSEPVSIVAGPDGALWFTEYAANKIGRIAVDGSVTEFPVPTAKSRPDSIVAGPDGALWFTEGAVGKIGRVTTTGEFSAFRVPTHASEPASMTAGPDGALWFVERSTNKVGRITMDGQISEFKAKSRNLSLTGIAAGPDGAIWFGAGAGGGDYADTQRIERMALDGTVTGEFALQNYVDAVAVLTQGPDGAVWFTESDSHKVGRIAPDGKIDEFKTRTADSSPTGITAGPDGALWFAEQTANKIGRITVDGKMTEYRLPTPSAGPFWVTAGPDGALWFTEYGKNRIGRIDPAVAAAQP